MLQSLKLSTCQMLTLASAQYRISHSFLCIQKRRTILVGLIEHSEDNQDEPKSKSIGLKCAMARSLELSTCQMLTLASVQYRISHSFLCIQKRRTILVGLIEHPKMVRTSKSRTSIGLMCTMLQSLKLSTCQMLTLASAQYRISHSFLSIQKLRTIFVGLIEHPKKFRMSPKISQSA